MTDHHIEDLLAGRCDATDPELGPVVAFLSELRAATVVEPDPSPSPALAAVLAGVAPAAGNGTAVAARPGWRERLDDVGERLRVRIALAVAIVLTGTTGVAGAGGLPGPAQDAADRAFEAVGLERPNMPATPGVDDAPATPPPAQTQDDSPGPASEHQTPPSGAGFEPGDQTPSELAPEAPQLDGRGFGVDVSGDASEHGTQTSEQKRPDATGQGQPGAPTDAGEQSGQSGQNEESGTPSEQAPIDEAPPAGRP